MDRAVSVQSLAELFPEFSNLGLGDFPDGGFECSHAQIHGRS